MDFCMSHIHVICIDLTAHARWWVKPTNEWRTPPLQHYSQYVLFKTQYNGPARIIGQPTLPTWQNNECKWPCLQSNSPMPNIILKYIFYWQRNNWVILVSTGLLFSYQEIINRSVVLLIVRVGFQWHLHLISENDGALR